MWRPVLYAVAGLVAGGALGAILSPQKGAVLAALTGALVATAGSTGPTKVSVRLASLAAAAGMILVFAAFVVNGHPWWAAAAMAAVAILTSCAAAAGQVHAALGMLGSITFVLAVIGTATLVGTGCVGAVRGAAGGSGRGRRAARGHDWRRPPEPSSRPGVRTRRPRRMGTDGASLRSFDEHARDGVRRAIPLAIGMFIYQRSLDHDTLWVFSPRSRYCCRPVRADPGSPQRG